MSVESQNARALAELNEMIRRLREVSDIPEKVAPDVADAFQDVIRENIAAAQGPSGETWQPKKDGGSPLQTAANALTVTAQGVIVTARLIGHIARHHRGWVKGGIRRAILPAKALPSAVSEAIRRVIHRHLEGHFDG